MPTIAGIECPACHERATVNMGIVDLDVSTPGHAQTLEAGKYSVCEPCFDAQYVAKYGYTPADAPSYAPADPEPFVEA